MKKFLAIIFLSIFISNSLAAEKTVNLVVEYKNVNFTGKTVKAIAVNNQIPAPTLHFREGDQVTINVYNHLNKETAIHWHGVLVPWQMDGVLGVSQHGIKSGKAFQYRFKLMQSGTYWYHAHAGLQEQQGLYGAFIIDPLKDPSYKIDKDYTIILSDWSNANPEQILANLKKDGDYYSPRFPLQPTLVKFIRDYHIGNPVERQYLVADYKMMQQMRMSLYDINDIAYDAFLLNGQPKVNPWTAPVKVGDVVRLRFIGAGTETIFHVKIPGSTMQMVHIEGNNVKPYQVADFTIAPGETYDVLVKIDRDAPYIIYAESLDTVGAAYGALTTQPQQFINYSAVRPFPEPLPVTREMMANMMQSMSNDHDSSMHSMSMNHDSMADMDMRDNSNEQMLMAHSEMYHRTNTTHTGHSQKPSMNEQHMNMEMPTEPSSIGDKRTPYNSAQNDLTVGTKYQNLTAKLITNNPSKPIAGVIKMELFGYMNHFIWMINGLTEYQTKPIVLESGKRYRIIFTNNSMMRHPMHIHGHWFILRNGHGAYDPLLHTIEVAPGSTVVVDIDTDASGQWFFHCHMNYHMISSMARVFQYSTLIELTKNETKPQNIVKTSEHYNRPIIRVDETCPLDLSLVHHPMGHPPGLWLATYLEAGEDPFHNAQRLTYKGLYGSDYNKLELFTNDAELYKGTAENADIDIFYWHLISQFWAIKGGASYFYRPAFTPYWQPGIGIEGLMPYFIDTNVRAYYHSGSAKLDLELSRDTQITNNFFIRLGARGILASKTVKQASIGSGLNQMRYILRPYYRLMPGLNIFAEYEYEQNYGVFKSFQNNAGEQATQNTVTLGLSVLF